MSETIHLQSRRDLPKLAKALENKLSKRTLFLFVGEVGSGKTTTVGELCKLLGMREVASPSFAIHHSYQSKSGKTLDHVDLYRLKNEDDLESTGFWDLFSQPEAWIVVEWADQLSKEVWPLDWTTYEVKFIKNQGEQRTVEINQKN